MWKLTPLEIATLPNLFPHPLPTYPTKAIQNNLTIGYWHHTFTEKPFLSGTICIIQQLNYKHSWRWSWIPPAIPPLQQSSLRSHTNFKHCRPLSEKSLFWTLGGVATSVVCSHEHQKHVWPVTELPASILLASFHFSAISYKFRALILSKFARPLSSYFRFS